MSGSERQQDVNEQYYLASDMLTLPLAIAAFCVRVLTSRARSEKHCSHLPCRHARRDRACRSSPFGPHLQQLTELAKMMQLASHVQAPTRV
jgi:hypothetical protein